MAKSKKKGRKDERRVLLGAIVVAGVITAGSTFAWFTSTDEVTNRLSASASYDVSIAEDFQPPEDWLPGQTINKDVSAVNTGNIDAFVRMWLEGEMSVLARDNQTNAASANTVAGTITPVTDKKYTALNLNYSDANGKYYRELSQEKVKNPELNDSGDAAESGNTENNPATFSEVQAVQAGGYLAAVPASAQFYYIVERATSISAYATTDAANKTNFELKEGDVVATKGATIPDDITGTKVYIDAGTAGINIDTSQFFPQTSGVYIFRRNVGLATTANTMDDYEYSGYYFEKAGSTTLLSTAASDDHYFALYTDTEGRSDYTIPDNAITTTGGEVAEPSKDVVKVVPTDNLKFYTASETVVKNDALKWVYTAAAGTNPAKLTAYYAGGDGTLGKQETTSGSVTTLEDKSADDIAIEITLANVGDTAETWKPIAGTTTEMDYYPPSATTVNTDKITLNTNGKWTFYYNNDVEAGDTTRILVDSVKLSDDTTQFAYLAFDFDLNVFLESVQVTTDEDGKEMVTPVTPWNATTGANNTGATTTSTDGYVDTANYTGNELNNAAWTAT
jgi:alternate signal-mediated exported protein